MRNSQHVPYDGTVTRDLKLEEIEAAKASVTAAILLVKRSEQQVNYKKNALASLPQSAELG